MATPQATYQDFVHSFNDEELAELSYLHLPGTNEINKEKIEYHLQRAANDWLSWFGFSDYTASGVPQECLGSAVSCEIAIARRRLDFNNPRDSVQAEFDFCYQIARDWKEDQKDIGDSGNVPGVEDVMSIFTI